MCLKGRSLFQEDAMCRVGLKLMLAFTGLLNHEILFCSEQKTPAVAKDGTEFYCIYSCINTFTAGCCAC